MNLKKAIYLMVLSTVAFTVMNGLIKHLSDYNAYQLVFFRSAGSLFFTFGFLLSQKIPILGNNPKILITRGVLGLTSMLLFFTAIKYMPIGSAVALRYLAPIFAAIFAVILLKEKVHHIQWLFFIIAFSGVLVLKGFDDSVPVLGIVLILVSSVFTGLVYIVIRKIGQTEHPVVVVNYFMCIATLLGGVVSIFNWKTPTLIDVLLLSSLGVFGYFGQLFMTKAFQMGETNIIAPLKYVEVIFAIIMGVGFLGESYSLWSFIGMFMIIGGMLLNVWYKRKYPTVKKS